MDHGTAKTQIRYLFDDQSGPFLLNHEAEAEVASVCVTYLAFDTCRALQSDPRHNIGREESILKGNYVLLPYVAEEWIYHVRRSNPALGGGLSETLGGLLFSLFRRHEKIRAPVSPSHEINPSTRSNEGPRYLGAFGHPYPPAYQPPYQPQPGYPSPYPSLRPPLLSRNPPPGIQPLLESEILEDLQITVVRSAEKMLKERLRLSAADLMASVAINSDDLGRFQGWSSIEHLLAEAESYLRLKWRDFTGPIGE
jgi:hypothetical protein